jgi:hypothetical protein
MTYIHPKRTESYKKEHPWDFQCFICKVMCESENAKRYHIETVHRTCCYCATKDMSLEHVAQEHIRVCVWCHKLGIYAPTMRGREDEIEHLKKYHPQRQKILV